MRNSLGRGKIASASIVALAVAALSGPQAMGATPGDAGLTSSGSISILASIRPAISVSGVAGTQGVDGGEPSVRKGCLSSNIANQAYAVSVSQRSAGLRVWWSTGGAEPRELSENPYGVGFVTDGAKTLCGVVLEVAAPKRAERRSIVDDVTILIAPM